MYKAKKGRDKSMVLAFLATPYTIISWNIKFSFFSILTLDQYQSALCTVVLNKRIYNFWSIEKYRNPPTECVTNDPKLVPTIQCQAGPYIPSNSCRETTTRKKTPQIHSPINTTSKESTVQTHQEPQPNPKPNSKKAYFLFGPQTI